MPGCHTRLPPMAAAPDAAPPGALPGETLYTAELIRHEDRGDHVEYLISVSHRSGLQWEVWRRFSEIHKLNSVLATAGPELDEEIRFLPAPPSKSFIPSALQALAGEFCRQRHADLQRYLDAILHSPRISRHSAVQDLLGVCTPEPPAALRVVPKRSSTDGSVCHELEIRPCVGVEAAPVEGYEVEIKDLDSEQLAGPPFRREVGCDGQLPQRARVGQLVGFYRFTAMAYNYAGMSAPVSVEVDTRLLMAPTNEPLAEVWRCGDAQAQRAPPHMRPHQVGAGGNAVGLESSRQPVCGGGLAAPSAPWRGGVVRNAVANIQAAHDAVARRPREGGAHPLGAPCARQSERLDTGATAALSSRGARGNPVHAAPPPRDARAGPGTAARPVVRPAPARPSPTPLAAQSVGTAREAGDAPEGDEDDEKLCVVCLSAAKTHAFLPCGHRCVCVSCGSEILNMHSASGSTCPICRAAVAGFVQIFT